MMHPDLEHLIVLQAQDLDLARLRTQLAEAPRRVKTAESNLQVAVTSLGAVQTALAAEEKLRRHQESEVATHKVKVERLRRSLDAATSAAQVAAFERELSFAQTTISSLEDEELASMERTETLEAEQKTADVLAQQRRNELEAERSRLTRITAENTEQITGIEQQRISVRAQIADNWLGIYDRLAKTKGTAIAEAVGTATQGKCAACQMSVRPQRWQDLTGRDHNDQIFTCETCGRMLFWDPRRDTPKPWEAGDRLRRAQTGAPQGGAR